jgi:signal transduction histidine kinase
MFHSLSTRLLFGFLLVVILAVGTVAFLVNRTTTTEFQGYVERGRTMLHHRLMRVLVAYYGRNLGWSGVQPLIEQMGQIFGERVILVDAEGKVVGDSQGDLLGRAITHRQGLVYPVTIRGMKIGTLYLSRPKRTPIEEAFLASVNRSVILVVLIAAGGGILLTLWFSQRTLSPIKELIKAVRKMQQGDLNQRVEVNSKDEIGELARAFNAMAAGLKKQEELRRNMVTDIAHELRTPLSNVRGYLEALREGLIEPTPYLISSLHEEVLLLNRLVDDLQDLALAEAGQLTLKRQPVVLEDIVQKAVGFIRPQAKAKGLKLRVDLPEDLLVSIDPQRMVQVLRNLLQNAVRHTERGEIAVSATRQDHWVKVKVSDTGEGISPQDLPYVFQRFYRADKSRSRSTGGAGLGLTIAKQLIEAHGGTIQVESIKNKGTTFTFTIPLASDSYS